VEGKVTQRVFVDFQKTDANNGNLVPTFGTRRDLARLGIGLEEGLRLSVYDADADFDDARDDLIAEVRAVWEPIGQRWTLEIVEGTLRHESEVLLSQAEAEAEAFSAE
jgi:hypothetical protein